MNEASILGVERPWHLTDEEWQEYQKEIVNNRKANNIYSITQRSWNDRNREIILRFLLERLSPEEVSSLRNRLESIT